MFLEQVFGDGIAVNVNGSYGQLTRDPATGKMVVDVNTTGRPVHTTNSPITNVFAGLPGWAPLAIVIGVFIVAMRLLANRR